MMERKAFLANPKHQYHASQWREHDYTANNKNNKDYYKYPSLSHFMDELWFCGKYRKKSFSCKTKALVSCKQLGEHDCNVQS